MWIHVFVCMAVRMYVCVCMVPMRGISMAMEWCVDACIRVYGSAYACFVFCANAGEISGDAVVCMYIHVCVCTLMLQMRRCLWLDICIRTYAYI